MFSITVGGDYSAVLDRQIQALSDASLTTIMEATGRAVGVATESVISPYPPASGKPLAKFYPRRNRFGQTYMSKWKSARQQGYVFSLIARGLVPTKRTGLLGRSITSDVSDVTTNAVTVQIGTNVNYAPYVISRAKQSFYHRNNWHTLEDDIEQGLPVINEAASAAFIKAIRALM